MTKRTHALVIGGSMTGLTAAATLARHFERVTVLERDTPSGAQPRKGAPQGHHIHILLRAGFDVLSRLFPGFGQDLVQAGGGAVDPCADTAWHQHGTWRARAPMDFDNYIQSRPLLESVVRRRVEALDNVTVRHGVSVRGLRSAGDRFTGAILKDGSCLDADLIVDATGRGSRVDRWLADHGFAPVEATEVEVNLTYTSRRYRLPAVDWALLAIHPTAPDKRGAAVLRQEDGTYIVTLVGWCGERAESTDEGFAAFARSLATPYLGELLARGKAVSNFKRFRYGAARRRHFERSPAPAGLVVVGDAMCSFDPVYGQGMAAHAMVVEALGEAVAASQNDAALPAAFYRRAAAITQVPWDLSTAADFQHAEVVGTRPLGWALSNALADRVARACTDPWVMRRFLRVINLLEHPNTLLDPRVLVHALFRGERTRTGELGPPPAPIRAIDGPGPVVPSFGLASGASPRTPFGTPTDASISRAPSSNASSCPSRSSGAPATTM